MSNNHPPVTIKPSKWHGNYLIRTNSLDLNANNACINILSKWILKLKIRKHLEDIRGSQSKNKHYPHYSDNLVSIDSPYLQRWSLKFRWPLESSLINEPNPLHSVSLPFLFPFYWFLCLFVSFWCLFWLWPESTLLSAYPALCLASHGLRNAVMARFDSQYLSCRNFSLEDLGYSWVRIVCINSKEHFWG